VARAIPAKNAAFGPDGDATIPGYFACNLNLPVPETDNRNLKMLAAAPMRT
jgi:hypothetical protein